MNNVPALRTPGFLYRNHELRCESVPLSELAQKFGTPLYVYSAATIGERFRAFRRGFGRARHTVCYSVKANSNLAVLGLLHRLGAGFDVVSGGELARVLKVDRRAGEDVVFSGVGKTAAEIAAALRAGILMFNVESESELAVLARCAARAKKKARVALRVNPHIETETHPYISTGLREHKFGVAIEQAREIYAHIAEEKYLEAAGISVHIGSQITDMEPFRQTMLRVAELARQLAADGHRIPYVDAGGGLGISYQGEDDFPARARAYAQTVLRPLRGLKIHLLLEPGRALVGPAGALLTRVLYIKSNDHKRFVVVDAAMNDLLRPALYSAYHEIVPVVNRDGTSRAEVDIVGPVCESGDFLARDRQMPMLSEGELLAVMDAGAYGMSLASNYNTRGRPAEVMVEGTKARLIRRRETAADMMRGERK
ncbi:MAG TPA: diaminopimelate decarboxylase [Terriglobales bacterium]|nr:diaminopimelate decarboxylase [Terriglobales bacterium]